MSRHIAYPQNCTDVDVAYIDSIEHIEEGSMIQEVGVVIAYVRADGAPLRYARVRHDGRLSSIIGLLQMTATELITGNYDDRDD